MFLNLKKLTRYTLLRIINNKIILESRRKNRIQKKIDVMVQYR